MPRIGILGIINIRSNFLKCIHQSMLSFHRRLLIFSSVKNPHGNVADQVYIGTNKGTHRGYSSPAVRIVLSHSPDATRPIGYSREVDPPCIDVMSLDNETKDFHRVSHFMSSLFPHAGWIDRAEYYRFKPTLF